MAAKYKDQIDGLLLRVPLIEPDNSSRNLAAFQPLVLDEQAIENMSAADKKLLGSNVLVRTPEYIAQLAAKYKEVYLPAMKTANSKLLGEIRNDPQRYRLAFEMNDKFYAPNLIVCGRQDGVVGYRDSLRLLELYPRSAFVILDRAGYDLPVGDGDVFNATVRDWISRVDEWRGQKNI